MERLRRRWGLGFADEERYGSGAKGQERQQRENIDVGEQRCLLAKLSSNQCNGSRCGIRPRLAMMEQQLGAAFERETVSLVAGSKVGDECVLVKLRSPGKQSGRDRNAASGSEVTREI